LRPEQVGVRKPGPDDGETPIIKEEPQQTKAKREDKKQVIKKARTSMNRNERAGTDTIETSELPNQSGQDGQQPNKGEKITKRRAARGRRGPSWLRDALQKGRREKVH